MEETFLLEEEKEFKRFYRFSVWWVGHKAMLRRILLGLLLSFDAILLVFVLWTFLDSFAISYGTEEREVAKLVAYGQEDLRSYTVANAASEITVNPVSIFSIGDQRQDFYTEISNPNDDWWAQFTYRFIHEGGSTSEEAGFLLPGQSKPVVALAVPTDTQVKGAVFELSNLKWHRINRHDISDYQTWQDDRLLMEITDAAFTRETGFAKEAFGRTTFKVYNRTAFGYHDPSFIVLLKRGTSVVGVNRATMKSIGPGERTEVSLNWFGTLPAVSSVEVVPDIDVFDPSVYQRLEGINSIDTRTQIRTR